MGCQSWGLSSSLPSRNRIFLYHWNYRIIPIRCGGVVEAAKGIRSGDFDEEKILEYIDRIGNTGVLRRFGYLCDLYGLNIDMPSIESRNYLLLDPTLPKKGDKSSKWRLTINLDKKELKVFLYRTFAVFSRINNI